MIRKLVLILVLTIITKISYSQIIDRYGINIGASYSTQIWDYKLISLDLDNEYKTGFQVFIQAEKDLGKIMALRTEIGYIQKGFRDDIEFRYSNNGPALTKINDNVVLHDIALNIGLKIKPLKADYLSPYIIAGLRADYMFSYKDIEFEEPNGNKINLYKDFIEEFNEFNVGGLIGLGIEWNRLLYFEVEYNPGITKSLNNKNLSIRDNCWGAKIGLNINKLIG